MVTENITSEHTSVIIVGGVIHIRLHNVGTIGHCDYGMHDDVEFFDVPVLNSAYYKKPKTLIQNSWQKMNKGCLSKKERRINNPQRRVLSHVN